ncbi:unnamed protein product [Moneuplotes crassus]|uniref:Uncharacterized protein n=1 Tax=Euplotes crassus TaxID=5936 RepID=A0AAD1XCG6_EUPCR|nr:unnamed protein product [Moneuplotes crassus]
MLSTFVPLRNTLLVCIVILYYPCIPTSCCSENKTGDTKMLLDLKEHEEETCIEVDEWLLQGETKSDSSIFPNTEYFLATIVSNKFTYLGQIGFLDVDLVKEKEGHQIELEIVEKSQNTVSVDQAEQAVTANDPYIVLDHQSHYLNYSHHYNFEGSPTSDTLKELMLIEVPCLTDIPLTNSFFITYFPHQRRILFTTALRFYNSLEEYYYYAWKYLGYEDEILTICTHPQIFEVEGVSEGQDLLTNFQLLIKVPNMENTYLRRVPTNEPGVNKIIASVFEQKKKKEFLFHLTKLNSFDRDIERIDRDLFYAKRKCIISEEESIRELDTESLRDIYISMKQYIHYFLKYMLKKEPNATKCDSSSYMCINGYQDVSLLYHFNQAFEFEKYLKILKDIRTEYLTREKDCKSLNISHFYYYFCCCEYILALGCSDPKTTPFSALKNAKTIITHPLELTELHHPNPLPQPPTATPSCPQPILPPAFNPSLTPHQPKAKPNSASVHDYRRVMSLQRICEHVYGIGDGEDVYELKCFLPFVNYEFDRGLEECNLNILYGIMTSNYKDAFCVWSGNRLNIPAIKFICRKLRSLVSEVIRLDIERMIQRATEYKNEKLRDTEFTDRMYFRGRAEVQIKQHLEIGTNADQNSLGKDSLLRSLFLLVVYSMGIRIGVESMNYFSKDWGELIIKCFKHDIHHFHIQGLLIRFFTNIYSYNVEDEVYSEVKLRDIDLITTIIIEKVKVIEDFESVDALFFMNEAFELFLSLLQSPYNEDMMSFKLQRDLQFNFLLKVLLKLSKIEVVGTPHAFDYTKFTHLYDKYLIEANDALANNKCGEVDVVIQSYHRDIVLQIFKIFCLMSKNRKHRNKKGGVFHQLHFSPRKFYFPLKINEKDFIRMIHDVIIKWINFEDEPDISSKIFDTIMKFDKPTIKAGQELAEISRFEEDISTACLKTLPFFTHLNESDVPEVVLLEQKLDIIKSEFIEANEMRYKEQELYDSHMNNIWNIILLITKANGLIDFDEDTNDECVYVLYQFISNCYECLIEASKYPLLSESIWKFNGNFFSICWKNKSCNDLHQELLMTVLRKCNIAKLNLDSFDLLRAVASKLGHCLHDKEKLINGEISGKFLHAFNPQRNRVKRNERLFEYAIHMINQHPDAGLRSLLKASKGETSKKASIHNEGYDLQAWCREEGMESSLMRIIKKKFRKDIKVIEDEEAKGIVIRRFQLFIHRLLQNIETLYPNSDTQDYILHSCAMLAEVLNDDKIMKKPEIKFMFYTEHSIKVIFSLILRQYNFLDCAPKMRHFAFLFLAKLVQIDIKSARKCFRVWTHSKDNKNKLFDRIINLAGQFNSYFCDENISRLLINDLDKTDYKEFILVLKWLTMLCKNNTLWQNYLSKQDNSVQNQNLLLPILEILRTGVLCLNHEYVIDLLRTVVGFMIETINGRNEYHINQYVTATVFQYSIAVIQAGFSSADLEFLRKAQKESSFELSKNAFGRTMTKASLAVSQKLNLLKQEVLCMINCLILPGKEHFIRNEENYECFNNMLKLNYVQYRIYKYDNYTTELFNQDSKLSKVYNINLGFQCYYLIAELWDNNYENNLNCVQLIDTEKTLSKYWKLVKSLWFKFNPLKGKYKQIVEQKYRPFENDKNLLRKATRFFDSYSSNIEIVMPDGRMVNRYFEILPPFLSFTQTEKDSFWIQANLDNSKTAVASFASFADDKIDELFIQQEIQNLWFCPRDVSKNNWLSDILRILILMINFIIFFSLEINEGEILDKPQLFDLSFSITKTIQTILGILILLLFGYITMIQGAIMIKLQSKRALKREEDINKRKKSIRILKLISYMVNNLEDTFQIRNIWCLLTCLGFSLAGIFVDFFWFSFTLTYMLIFSPQILEVTNAVWKPKKRIGSTVILSSIILYWFSIIAYVYFSNDFNLVVEGSNETLLRCIAVIFDSWYKFGLGAFLAENGRSSILEQVEERMEYKIHASRMIFDFLFFFIVPTLLLSILSGIIIDNFGERRAKSDSIKQRQNDLCFVCGKLSSDLADFEHHCKFTHNIWDYMYYIGYIRSMKESQRKDYRDIHVFNCLKLHKNDWFPAYQDFAEERAKHQMSQNMLGEIITNCSNEHQDKSPSEKDSEFLKEYDQKTVDQFVNTTKQQIEEINNKIEDKISSVHAEMADQISSIQSEMKTQMDCMSSKIDLILSKINPSKS